MSLNLTKTIILLLKWSYSDPNYRETTAAVDDNGVFYAMYVTETAMVVEIFVEE